MSKRPSLAETMRQAAAAPEPEPQQQIIPARALETPGTPRPAQSDQGFYAATRVGRKKVTAVLAPGDHKRLRQLALDRDLTTEALLSEAISDLFTKYGKPAIAGVRQGAD